MAVNQEYKEYRVNELPETGYAGDRYYLNVGGGKFQTYIISDALTPVREAGQEFIECDTVDDLRNLDARQIWAIQNGYYKGVTLNGYYAEGDTPTPIQYYLSDTTEVDDGGSVFEVDGIKLEHKFVGSVNILYFGAKADFYGEEYTDNTLFFSKVDYYLTNGYPLAKSIENRPSLIIPKCEASVFGYGCSDDIFLSGSYNVFMESPLIRIGANRPNSGAFLKVGQSSDTERISNTNKVFDLYVRSSTVVWDGSDYSGIEVRNQARASITIRESYGFDVGCRFLGYNAGFAYNKISIFNILNNRVGLDYKSYSPNGDSSGYITSCVTDNYGRIGNNSNVGSLLFDRIGIRIGIDGASGYTPESLTFNNGIIEGLIASSTPNEYKGIPVLIESGNLNNFENFRHEGNFRATEKGVFLKVLNGGSNKGFLTIVVPIGTTGETKNPDSYFTEDLSITKQGNTVVSRRGLSSKETLNERNIVWESGNFSKIFCKYNANSANIQGFGRVVSSGQVFRNLVPNSLPQSYYIDSDNYLNIPSGGGLFMEIDTNSLKRLAFFVDEYELSSCKLFYYCYDSSGNVLAPGDNIFGFLSKNVSTYGANGATDYQAGVLDLSSRVRNITVSDEVKKLRVILSGLNNTRVKSLKVLTVDGYGSTDNVSVFSDPYNHATEPPSEGSYKKGRVILNDNSVNDGIYGWVAISDGVDDDSIWKSIPVGEKVSKEGATASSSDGSILSGDLSAGSITQRTISGTTSINYPTTSGNVITFNGASYQRTFSIFTPHSSGDSNIYSQSYNSSGVGLGWVKLTIGNATTTVKGVVNQAAAVPDGSSIDTLLASLRAAGILAI